MPVSRAGGYEKYKSTTFASLKLHCFLTTFHCANTRKILRKAMASTIPEPNAQLKKIGTGRASDSDEYFGDD